VAELLTRGWAGERTPAMRGAADLLIDWRWAFRQARIKKRTRRTLSMSGAQIKMVLRRLLWAKFELSPEHRRYSGDVPQGASLGLAQPFTEERARGGLGGKQPEALEVLPPPALVTFRSCFGVL